jgi:hypothetical protein
MKKLFILSLAAAFVVALSMPAWAWVGADQVQFGARINQEIGWQSKSKEQTVNGEDDINRSYLKTNSNSYLRLKFMSKDKSQGAMVELGVGSGSALGSNTISTRHAYGWYKVGNCTLTVGHTDNWVGNTFWGAQKLQAETHSGDILGWGKAWAPRRAQVQLKYAAGKMATLMFALARPAKDGTPTNASTAGMDKYYQIPQLEVAVQLKGKTWAVIPSAVWYQARFDKTPSGYDDTVTSWGLILPFNVAFGAFSVMGEIHYGQNPNNIWSGYGEGTAYMKASGSVEDSKNVGGFLQLGYKVGKSTIHVGAGMESFTNDAWKSDAGYKDDNVTRKMYWISVPTKIGQNLWLYPEFDYYDYDQNLNDVDKGNEWVLGLLFRFLF